MAMSQDEIDALNDSIRQLSTAMQDMTQTFQTVAGQSRLTSQQIQNLGNNTNRTNNNINTLGQSTGRAGSAVDNFSNSTEEATKRQAAYNRAKGAATDSVLKLSDAMISTERGFKKFSGVLNSAGDAAMELGKSFGGYGEIVGRLAKSATFLVGKQFEQADAVFNARKELQSFAGSGKIGSSQLLDMAQAIGFTSQQLDVLIKPLKSLGPTLVTLGGSASEGVARFGEIGKVDEETRKRFIRMGVMPEELLQSQADYINLQRLSGNQASLRLKTDKQIQQESLAYAESLKVLSELTGDDAETIKKRQEAAMNDYRFQIKMSQMNQEISRLTAANLPDQAAALKAQRDNIMLGVRTAAGFSSGMSDLAKSLILTDGNITEFTRQLGVAGVDTKKFADEIKAGDPDAMLNLLTDIMDKAGDQVENFGDLAGYLSDGQLKLLGLDKDMMHMLTTYAAEGMDFAKAYRLAAAQVAERGAEGNDVLSDSQAELTIIQQKVATGLDDLLQNTNPLISGFNKTTIATTALATAAGIAAAALAAMSLKSGVSGLLGGAAPIALGSVGLFAAKAAAAFAGGYAAGTGINELSGIGFFGGKRLSDRLSGMFTSDAERRANEEMTRQASSTPTVAARPATQPGDVNDDRIKAQIRQHEETRTEAYDDGLGNWTIGVGHHDNTIKEGMTWSPEEVERRFEQDYQKAKTAAAKIPGYDSLNAEGKEALIDLTFNMGPDWVVQKGFVKFEKAMTEGNIVAAVAELRDSKWNDQVKGRADTITAQLGTNINTNQSLARTPEPQPVAPSASQTAAALAPPTTTASTGTTTAQVASTANTTPSRQTEDITQQLMTMISHKLDTVIAKLDESVDVQNRTYRAAV
jgi:GH24 family phage-related lysozyme (muramidase)